MRPPFTPGSHVRLTADVDNFPTCLIKAGETGTIADMDDDCVWVRLDAHHPELSKWGNDLQISFSADYPAPLEAIGGAA